VVTHANNRAFKELGLIPLEPDDDTAVVIERAALNLCVTLWGNPSFGGLGDGLTQAREAALLGVMIRAAAILKVPQREPGPPGGETYFERAMREHPERDILRQELRTNANLAAMGGPTL
jgi:hypothetical protein